MTSGRRARVACFDFTCCEGCQIELTNVGQDVMLGLLDHIEFVEMREVTSDRTTGPIDIALIEGSFTREEERGRLEEIRRRAAIVIAYGACATTAGINALKNHQSDYRACVYGPQARMPHLDTQKAQPVSAAIAVDYVVHGCPIDRNELVYILSSLLHGKDPVIPNHPVCVECKMRETVCRYHVGDHCLGLVARAGCGAPCPADGIPCEACRGFIDEPNHAALVQVLMEKGGLSGNRAESKSRIFTATQRSDAA